MFKSYTDGSLSLGSVLTVSRVAPDSPLNGDFWLDNSKYPLTFKQYSSTGSTWNEVDDLVYIGDVTVASGLITKIKNNIFNACPGLRYVVEFYQDGPNGYAIYSDNWCEQWGQQTITTGATSGETVNLVVPYASTIYDAQVSVLGAQYTAIYTASIVTKSSIKIYCNSNGVTACWRTFGYTN